MWCLESKASLETDLESSAKKSQLQPKENTGKDEMRTKDRYLLDRQEENLNRVMEEEEKEN